MTSPDLKETDAQNPFFPRILPAFDLSSCGMGVMLFSTRRFFDGQLLTEWQQEAIQTANSNYIAQPYNLAWFRGSVLLTSERPLNQSLHYGETRELAKAMNAAYDSIDWRALRQTLAPEIECENLSAPMNEEEYLNYCTIAAQRGLMSFHASPESDLVIPENPLEFVSATYRNGGSLEDPFFATLKVNRANDEMLPLYQRASVLKLGTMLGITDQLTHDAKAHGTPIPGTLTQHNPVHRNNWKQEFGEEMPTLAELYLHAHQVFTSVADPNDPLTAYLFAPCDLSDFGV